MAKTATRSVELEPIDRLEEKVKLLVGMVDRMKDEQARAAEENIALAIAQRQHFENACPGACRAPAKPRENLPPFAHRDER